MESTPSNPFFDPHPRPIYPSVHTYLQRHDAASFAAKFPLSPELWQEWIDDRSAAGGEDALEDSLVLYGRAFADYQCAKLWPGYLETLEESLDVSPVDAVIPFPTMFFWVAANELVGCVQHGVPVPAGRT